MTSAEENLINRIRLLLGDQGADGPNAFELTRGPSSFVYKLLRNPLNDSDDMNVDGSITPVTFSYTVPADRIFELWRINWHIIDESIRADGFGGLTVLTNGMLLRIVKANEDVELDFTDGAPIKRHSEFSHLAGIDLFPDTTGVGQAEDALSIRWTIARAGRTMLLTAGQSIEFVVRDDIDGLTHFQAMVQGILRTIA